MENNVDPKLEKLINEGYSISITENFTKGRKIFEANPGYFVVYTLVYFIIGVIINYIPLIGEVLNFVITAPLMAGFFIVAHKINIQENYSFDDFFKGFDFFVPLCLAYLLGTVLIILGFAVLVIPGIYLMVSFLFFHLLIIFYRYDIWSSLEMSRRLITKNWWKFFVLVLALAGINILGAMVLIVGLLISYPLSFCIVYATFDSIVKISQNKEGEDDITRHLID